MEILLDGAAQTGLEPIARPDVFEVYKEDYAGMIEPETIGWGMDVDISNLEAGEHVMEAVLRRGNQTVDRKKVRFTVHD